MAPSPPCFILPRCHLILPKQAVIFTVVARGASVLCAVFWAFTVPWSRCLITPLSGHQALCSLGPHQWSPPDPEVSAHRAVWLRVDTGIAQLCVLPVRTLGLCRSTRTLTSSAPCEPSWISCPLSIGCRNSATITYLCTSSILWHCYCFFCPECKGKLFSLIPAQLLIYLGRNSTFSLFTQSDSLGECDLPKTALRFRADGWLLTTSLFQMVYALSFPRG